MKKKIVAIMLITAFVLSGCALAERFETAKDAYLEDRVSELLDEGSMPEDAPVDETVDAEPVLPTAEPEPEAEVEVTEEAETEVAETPEVAETEEVDDGEDDEMDDAEDAEEDMDADADHSTDESDADAEPEVESDDPGIYLGDPDWMDDMEPGEYYWPLGTDDYMSAAYDNGTLKLQALSETNGWRIASTPVLGDAYIEAVVTMGACSNTDGYGIIFHVPEKVDYDRGYLFGITCNGKYGLRSWDGLAGANGTSAWLKYYTLSDLINQGKDATNTLGVMTVGDRIGLFINGVLVEEIVDKTYDQGFFGLFINRDNTENLTINIDRVSYWTDPTE